MKALTLEQGICCALTALAFATPVNVRAGEGDTWLVGVLTLQHAERCTGTWDSEWVDPHFEVGFTRLVPVNGLDLGAWEGRLVRVRGVPAPPPVVVVEHAGECPGRQARDDWIFAKNGVRLRRTWPQALPPAFTALEVAPFDGLTVRRDGETLHLRFKNPFPDVTLDSVELMVHYEGCYGKPNTRTKHAKIGGIAPGAVVDVALPALAIDEENHRGRAVHRAWSVQVTAMSAGILFATDAPLRLFESGAVDCPNRDRKGGTHEPRKTPKTE